MNQKPVKYTPWFPVQKTLGSYQVTAFNYTFDGLSIELSQCKPNKDIKLKIFFPMDDTICRIMNETYRAELAMYYRAHLQELYPCGPLFRAEHSDYIKSLSAESHDLTDMLDFRHYLIDDSEWTFDIASQCQPQVELFIDGELVEKLECIHHSDLNKSDHSEG
jgi:hypothetical protein